MLTGCRFYDADKGKILCNGKDIAATDAYAYRKHLSLVAQEPKLFQGESAARADLPNEGADGANHGPGTLRENIVLGVDDSAVADERLHKVCRDAYIHDFIVSLPEGYNTNIGSKGVTLSGGQKQRVAIARALMRNPDILLLDEATSSLDSESERLVQAAFERASHGRTMVVVAHRLATVQNADVIFVLGDGKLLERGRHGELLRKRGAYWQMVSPPRVARARVVANAAGSVRTRRWTGERGARWQMAFPPPPPGGRGACGWLPTRPAVPEAGAGPVGAGASSAVRVGGVSWAEGRAGGDAAWSGMS